MTYCHVTTQINRGLREINRQDQIAEEREREIEELIAAYPDPVGVAEVVIDHIEGLAALASDDHIAAIDVAQRIIERCYDDWAAGIIAKRAKS